MPSTDSRLVVIPVYRMIEVDDDPANDLEITILVDVEFTLSESGGSFYINEGSARLAPGHGYPGAPKSLVLTEEEVSYVRLQASDIQMMDADSEAVRSNERELEWIQDEEDDLWGAMGADMDFYESQRDELSHD